MDVHSRAGQTNLSERKNPWGLTCIEQKQRSIKFMGNDVVVVVMPPIHECVLIYLCMPPHKGNHKM